MEFLGTIFGSIFSGGATGLVGVILQRFADYKNKQLDLALEKQRGELEVQKRQMDLQVMQAEVAGKTRVAEIETAGASDVAATQAFQATMFSEPARYSAPQGLTVGQEWILVLLDCARGIVRPLLTVYLCGLTTYVWYQVRTVLEQQHLDAAAAMSVWHLVVGNILYLTTTCVLWWFGTRNQQSAPKLR
jgi:hypothetical protein